MGFKAVLKNIFPFISAAAEMGGPLGTMAASAVGQVLGIKVDASNIDSAITAAQAKDPDIIIKLKQVENDFQLQLKRLGIDSTTQLESIAAQDRASAREREKVVKDKLPGILAIAVSGGFFGLLYLFIFREMPASNKEIISIMLGSLGTAWVSIIAYYFGSSLGSTTKTEILSGIVDKNK